MLLARREHIDEVVRTPLRNEPNPDYRPPPPPVKPWSERHPGILYTVLVGAVLGLGAATLSFRHGPADVASKLVMPRYFTLAESQRLLPEVERALRDALFHKAEYQKADEELDSNTERIRMSGGANVDRGAHLAVRARRDTSAAALKEALARVEQTGAVVKDLDIGLIDFLAQYQGRDVYLCWKLGEERIAWWHGIEEGFRGRKPIDEEFLKGNASETPN